MNRFMCGNLKSLQQPGIRDALLAFHAKWYSANIMKLVIVSNHSLDDMTKWVTEKFSAVENKKVEVPNLVENEPFTDNEMSRIVRFVPIKNQHWLRIMWKLPYLQECFDSKPISYFSHLVGHEGENSLLSYLREHGWALSLSSGPYHMLNGASALNVSIQLTELGLTSYTSVIEAVFAYN